MRRVTGSSPVSSTKRDIQSDVSFFIPYDVLPATAQPYKAAVQALGKPENPRAGTFMCACAGIVTALGTHFWAMAAAVSRATCIMAVKVVCLDAASRASPVTMWSEMVQIARARLPR